MAKASDKMTHKTYEFVCRLPPGTALERVGNLLSKEGVEYTASDLSIVSTRIPIVLLSIQQKLYSHSNWVGLNPFIYVSGIDVRGESGDDGLTKVTVDVDRLRAFLLAAAIVAFGALVAGAAGYSGMPEPLGALFFIAFTIAGCFGVVSFLAGYVLKREIIDCLEDR